MKCKNNPKQYPTNQVFSTKQLGLSDEFMRGVSVNETITRCSDDQLLSKYKTHLKKEPAIAYRDLRNDEFSYNLPVGYNVTPEFITNPDCEQFKAKPNRLTLNEIDLAIREQLARKRHFIKQLFDENSLNTKGEVSRGALLKILKNLCPLMDMEMFHRLIERYQLHKLAHISFKQFEESFTAPPLGRRPPPVIFHGLGAERCVSVAQAYRMLREIACDSRFDLKTVLPPSCFEPDGRILCPQLREALRLMRINLTDENYQRLWRDKFDLGHFGSIRTVDFCKILNLKEDGTPLELRADVVPLMTSNMKGIPKLNKNPLLWAPSDWPQFELRPPHAIDAEEQAQALVSELPTAGGTSFPINEPVTWVPKGPGGAMEPPFGCGDRYKTRLAILEEHNPKFENIIDCLRYKFEKPYQSMLVAFKRADDKNTNRVTHNKCLGILREYGLNIDSKGLESFLSRILSPTEATGYGFGTDRPPVPFDPHAERVVIKPGMVPYKRLLSYYHNLSSGSIVHGIISAIENKSNLMSGLKKTPVLTPDEIEEELVKILHKNFVDFYHELKKNGCSPGVIAEDKLRTVINDTIRFEVTDEQWEKFKCYLNYVKPGFVDFDHLLGLFAESTATARELVTENFDDANRKCQRKQDNYRGEIRDKIVLLQLVEHIVRTRLHHIDKSYKHYDQPEENMLSKEDFGELLSNQGLHLTLAELDYLWNLLDEIEPSRTLHSYRQVMNYFYNRTRPLVAEMMRQKRYSKIRAIHDPNLEALRKWRTDLKGKKSKDESELLKAGQIASTLPPRAVIFEKPSAEQLAQLCERISGWIQQHWDVIQRAFVDHDRSGATKLLWNDFKNILRQFNVPLSEKELHTLCGGFASRDKDYVNYCNFMKYFSKTLPKEQVLGTAFDERTYQFTNQRNGEKIGFADVIGEIKNACTSQWRTLQEAFNKFDTNKQGAIGLKEIDEILRKRGVQLSRDDLYHLLTSFDSDMKGCINYHDFKRTILKSFKPATRT